MRYRRDAPAHDQQAIAAETEHVRQHLAAVADAEDVTVRVVDHVDGDPELVSILGELDAQPDAPYLRPGYDPDADHADIEFRPFGEHDEAAFAAWRAGR